MTVVCVTYVAVTDDGKNGMSIWGRLRLTWRFVLCCFDMEKGECRNRCKMCVARVVSDITKGHNSNRMGLPVPQAYIPKFTKLPWPNLQNCLFTPHSGS